MSAVSLHVKAVAGRVGRLERIRVVPIPGLEEGEERMRLPQPGRLRSMTLQTRRTPAPVQPCGPRGEQ
jgi:hypothetical protein